MPFYSGDKEYSDQQVAADAKRCKKERHDWCEQQAREYLAAHPRRKYYFTEYYIPESEQETYIAWPQVEIDKIKKAIADDIAENGPYDEEDELEARREVIRELGLDLTAYIQDISMYEYHYVQDINFDKYTCCERVTILRFNKEDDAPRKTRESVDLTDEEYVRVLTELLYAPQPLSFDGLRLVLPDIGKKIWEYCASKTETSAVFLTELNEHVDAILAQHGGRENTPYHSLFDNIFAQIAEYQASKAEKKDK